MSQQVIAGVPKQQQMDTDSICKVILDQVPAEHPMGLEDYERSLTDVLHSIFSTLDKAEGAVLKRSGYCFFDQLQLGSFTHLLKYCNDLQTTILSKTFGASALSKWIVCDKTRLSALIASHEGVASTTGSGLLDDTLMCTIEWSALLEDIETLIDSHLVRLNNGSYGESSSLTLFDIIADMESKLLKPGTAVFNVLLPGQHDDGHPNLMSIMQILQKIMETVSDDDGLKRKLMELISIKGHSASSDLLVPQSETVDTDITLEPNLLRFYEVCNSQLAQWYQSRKAVGAELSELPEQDALTSATKALMIGVSDDIDLPHIEQISNSKLSESEANILFAPTYLQIDSKPSFDQSLDDDCRFADLSLAAKEELAEMFLALPHGTMCSKSLNYWYLEKVLGISQRAVIKQLPYLLYELRNELLVKGEDIDKKFFIVSKDELIVVAKKLPSAQEITDVLQSKSHSMLLAWMLRAITMAVSSQSQFFTNVCQAWSHAFTMNGNDAAAEWIVNLISLVPSNFSGYLMHLWMSNVMSAVLGGVSIAHTQTFFVRWMNELSGPIRWAAIQTVFTVLSSEHGGLFETLLEWANQAPIVWGSSKATAKSEDTSVTTQDSSISAVGDSHEKLAVDVNELTTAVATTTLADGTVVPMTKPKVADADNEFFCHNLIEEIFRSEDVQASFKGSFHNAVKLLSKINSRDVHFVLEVIQNAADNDYNDNVQPTLIIELNKKEVIVKSNEVGFVEKNVRAICSVGKSHKKTIGFIGHKGIG